MPFIDGKKVIYNDGDRSFDQRRKKERSSSKRATINCGSKYFQAAWQAELFAAWKGPEFGMTPLSKWVPPIGRRRQGRPGKMTEPPGCPGRREGSLIVVSKLHLGAGNRAIAVRYPGGFNLAWSTENMNLALVCAAPSSMRRGIDRSRRRSPAAARLRRFYRERRCRPLGRARIAGRRMAKLAEGDRPADLQRKGYELYANASPLSFTGGAGSPSRSALKPPAMPRPVPASDLHAAAHGHHCRRHVPRGLRNIQAHGEEFLVDGASKFIVSLPGAKVVGKDLLAPAQPRLQVSYSWPAPPVFLDAAH